MAANKLDLNAMSIDELWVLHEETSALLSSRIVEQKRELEKRLAILNHSDDGIEPPQALRAPKNRKPRRKYPKVLPRYRNPETDETWSGRGKQPRWLISAMQAGRTIDEFRIGDGAAEAY